MVRRLGANLKEKKDGPRFVHSSVLLSSPLVDSLAARSSGRAVAIRARIIEFGEMWSKIKNLTLILPFAPHLAIIWMNSEPAKASPAIWILP